MNLYSLLAREGFILYLFNEKGFSLVQTLISFTIVILLVTTIVPSIVHIKKEQNILKQRLSSAHHLHDILIEEINSKNTDDKVGNSQSIKYKIVYQDSLVEVCGSWTNIKTVQENRCYYGKKQAF